MWIRNNAESTVRLFEAWMLEHVDDPVAELPGDARGVVFDGPVQIRSDVGEELIERHDAVETHNTEDA